MSSGPAFSYELISNANPKEIISQASPRNCTAPYEQVSPGATTLVVFREGERNVPTGSLSVALRAGSFTTVLVSPGARQSVGLQTIDDVPLPREKGARLVIRNFLPGGAQARLTFDRLKIAEVSFTSEPMKVLRDFLPVTTGFSVAVRLPDGKLLSDGGEVDLIKHPNVTILMFLNPEGKARARVAIDGVRE